MTIMTIEQLINSEIIKKEKFIKGYTDQLLDLRELIAKINMEKEDLYKEMRRVCTHPANMIENTKEYEEGGYLNVYKTAWVKKCLQCNTVITTSTEMGGYA